MRKLQRRNIIIFSVFIAAIVLCYALLYPFAFVHDTYLESLRISVRNLKHPVTTSHIAFSSKLGLLSGNGNHCDYFVAEMRSYTGNKQQILAAYKQTRVWNPMRKQWFPVSIGFVESGKIRSNAEYSVMPELLERKFQRNLSGQQNVYFVVFFDVGHEVGLDMRCI
jgi:hypothetical protein